ncbi:transketolase [Candidatus Pelagibacter bacterium]|nr:transketolase [Candidatus Pelagibacter bacterium]
MSKYKKLSFKIRRSILKTAFSSQANHIGSSLSIVDILSVLYGKFLKSTKNLFILSKGHGCLAQYCVLKEMGLISDKTLKTFGKNNSILMSHSSHKVPGVHFSTGSLGHGLPVSAGIALGNKIEKSKSRVFVLLSDGELNEGSNWESLLFCSHHNLNNLTIIIDYNKIQSIDFVKNTLAIEPIKKKFESFGCKVLSIDGHNHKQLLKSFSYKSPKVLVIIANTIKGKGVKFMENTILWHYKPLSITHFESAIKELKQ